MKFLFLKVSYLFLLLVIFSSCREKLIVSSPLSSNEIAFIRSYVDGTTIWTMDRDGKNQHMVWCGKSHIETLSWSPDSKKIAFTYYPKYSSEMRLIDLQNKEIKCILKFSSKKLILPFFSDISWFPDGKKIICTIQGRDFKLGAGNKICIINSEEEGNIATIPTPFKYHSLPKISPDGKKISFESKGDIYIMNIDGTEIKKVRETSLGRNCALWSSNGKLVAFKERDPDSNLSNKITLLNLENNEKLSFSLGKEYPMIFNMCFSPDGKIIVTETGVRGTIRTDICTISLDTNEVKNLTNTPDCIETSPSW